MIIGVCGYARSGKDEIAKIFVEEYGFIRLSFADKVREAALAIDPLINTPIYFSGWRRLSDIVHDYGWDEAKKFEVVRELLQRLGMTFRDFAHDDIWVDLVEREMDKLGYPDTVIPDVRFPNESDWLFSDGGHLIHVTRPGVGPVNDHPSDSGLVFDCADFHLENDGTLENLRDKVREWAKDS